MSKNSDHVKRWRQNTKQRIIDSMGGSCCLCGYNKTQRALALHHIDPANKELSFGAIRATPKKWDSIVAELRKCILVCHNCHCEIHDMIVDIPDTAPRFDERYANYRDGLREVNDGCGIKLVHTLCPVCNEPKPNNQITCSRKCAGKKHMRVDWDSIDLVSMLKTKSYLSIADELGVSDAAVHKRAKKLGLK